MTEQQAQRIAEVKELIDDPPAWLQEWSGQVGAELKDGLREAPGWIAFARENGTATTVGCCGPFDGQVRKTGAVLATCAPAA